MPTKAQRSSPSMGTSKMSEVWQSVPMENASSVGEEKTVTVWDADKGTETLTLKGHTNVVSGVSLSADGKRIVSGSYDNTVKVWDADKGTEVLTLKGHTERVHSAAIQRRRQTHRQRQLGPYGESVGCRWPHAQP